METNLENIFDKIEENSNLVWEKRETSAKVGGENANKIMFVSEIGLGIKIFIEKITGTWYDNCLDTIYSPEDYVMHNIRLYEKGKLRKDFSSSELYRENNYEKVVAIYNNLAEKFSKD